MKGSSRTCSVLASALAIALVWPEPSRAAPSSLGAGGNAVCQTAVRMATSRRRTLQLKGDPLTVIQRPLLNIPALVTPGSTLKIECEADPLTTGWAAWLRRGAAVVPLRVVSSSYDASTTWWTVSAEIPAAVPVHDLYDLFVTADGDLFDCTRHAVKVIPAFRDDYYFAHITDTHLPTKLYYYEQGADTDVSEMVDLRAVMDDLQIINPEFVFLTGDVINEGELEEFLGKQYYTRTQLLLAEFQVPVYLTAGNHDIGGWTSSPPSDGTARRNWWRFFGWNRLDDPPYGAPWVTQNYSFDYGPVHYVALESYLNYDGWRSHLYGSQSFRAGQLQWLNADLIAAAGSTSQVLVYHHDFSDQIDLNARGVEMALSGHTHRDDGNIHQPPYDLKTDNVCNGDRSYRLIRVQNGTLQPAATLSAGSGNHLEATFAPANNGQHSQVTADVVNYLNERFEYGQLRFRMPKGGVSVQVTGGTLVQVDTSGHVDVYYVAVDILPNSTKTVTVTIT